MTKLLILGVIAMLVFGPEKLPQVARDAGRMLRQFRTIAQQARADLKSELGDSFGDFDVTDLNPRTFVRKHLFEDGPAAAPNGSARPDGSTPSLIKTASPQAVPAVPAVHAAQAVPTAVQPPTAPTPYDADAT